MAAMQQHAGDAAALLKALSNESRLMIMCTLMEGELTVGQLNDIMPLSQSALSQHLAALRQAELVQTRRQAQTIFYRLSGDNSIKIIEVLHSIFCAQD